MPDQPIQKCGQRFAYKCPKQWDALRETPEAGVRACDHCRKPVYLCQSETEVFHHTMRGDCIAVPARMHPTRPVPEEQGPEGMEPVDVLAARYGVPVAHLRDFELNPDLLKVLPREVAAKHHLVPLFRNGPALVVAMSHPASNHAMDDVRFITGYEVEVQVASWRDIQDALKRWPRDEDGMELGLPIMDAFFEPSTPIERLLHYLLTHAHREAVAQLRLEITDSSLVVRHLVEGTLREVLRPPLTLGKKLLHHLQEQSGAFTGQPGQLEYRASEFQADCEVRLYRMERGMEVVLVMTEAEFR